MKNIDHPNKQPMNLNHILKAIQHHYKSNDIQFLSEKMINGDYQPRKQLADLVCSRPAKLPAKMILEISRWGVNDELSQCQEIRELKK